MSSTRRSAARGPGRGTRRAGRRGIRLLLDYVPNHVAPDHPWVTSHPDLFVNGDEADIEADRHPGSGPAAILAHGRDPYFPPWPDVVQLNAFSPALRAATAATLRTSPRSATGSAATWPC
jgi:hypothetical protein